jgi:GTP-binding protein Era
LIKKKAAFVAVIGRPSTGKSTLVNTICGGKVSIVSAVPQTTRDAIRGIANREQGQLVFIDTPGRHKSDKKFNKKLSEVSEKAIYEADLILYLLDATRLPGPEESEIVSLLLPHAERTVIAVNKKDMQNADSSRIADFIAQYFTGFPNDRLFFISAKNNEGIDPLLAALFDMAMEAEPFYSEEYYTDQEVHFRITEIIREQAINRLRDELPHALNVEVADTQFTDITPDRQKLWVRAFIVVERESQKGIVVGKGGIMIKTIRLASLKELRSIFDWKIELDLWVKTAR